MTGLVASFPSAAAFIHAVESLPLRKRRTVLRGDTTPKFPRFLYKYRTVDASQDESVDRLRDILVRGRIWFSAPTAFNDPFDMAANIRVDGTAKARRERIAKSLSSQGKTWMAVRSQTNELMAKPIAHLQASIQMAHEAQKQMLGIYSVSEDPRGILMWSHYAANHTGVCLQFSPQHDPSTFAPALPVDYAEDYPVVDWIRNFQEELARSLLRKHIDWKYERERRIVVPGLANRLHSYRPSALTGVILGCRSDSETKAAVLSLLSERIDAGHPPVCLYQAVQHTTMYRLAVRTIRSRVESK